MAKTATRNSQQATAEFGLPPVLLRDRARYQFTLGLRAHNEKVMIPAVRRLFEERAVQAKAEGLEVERAEAALALVDDAFAYRFSRWSRHNQQRMMWRALAEVEAEEAVSAQLAAERADLPAGPYGSLTIDPDYVMPKYYSDVNFHLMPGSFHGNNLVYIFQHYLQTRSLVAGNTKNVAERAAPAMPPNPRRILDVGCGSGRSTFPLKEMYPEADVYGIDVAANLVTNAHIIAQHKKLDVHFSQQAGEATTFPDGFFDVVQIWTLQHEMPEQPMQAVFEEAVRICAPGGRVINADIVPLSRMEPLERALREWEVDYFEEPYLRTALNFDIPAMLSTAGLTNVKVLPPENFPHGMDFPWMTFGDKPAA